jgi:hypothetical protein
MRKGWDDEFVNRAALGSTALLAPRFMEEENMVAMTKVIGNSYVLVLKN